jgi:hypothetical protein
MGLLSHARGYLRRWRLYRPWGLAKRKWMTYTRARQEQFRAILANDAYHAAFDGDFIKSLAQAKAEREKASNRLWLSQMVFVGFLALTAIPIEAEISLFGLSAKSTDKLKEVVLFISAVTGALASFITGDIVDMRAALEVVVERRVGPHAPAAVKDFLGLPYLPHVFRGFVPLPLPPQPGVSMSPGAFLWAITTILVGLLILMAVALIPLTVHIYVMVDIARNPGLPWYWTWVVIGFTAACDLFVVLTTVLVAAPLPYWDFGPISDLAELEKADPTAYAQKIDEIAKAAVRRQWLKFFGMRGE